MPAPDPGEAPRIVPRNDGDSDGVVVGALPTGNLLLLDGEGRILLGLRAAEETPDAGMWNLPGGKCEAGERPIDTVIRETFEEFAVTLSEADLRPFARYRCFYPDRVVDADYFLARLDGEVAIRVDAREFSRGGFFDLREAAGWTLAFRQEVVLQALLASGAA